MKWYHTLTRYRQKGEIQIGENFGVGLLLPKNHDSISIDACPLVRFVNFAELNEDASFNP